MSEGAAAVAEPGRLRWGSHLEFILTAIGLAVGAANVWRFPYLAQKNGGGAFLIPYGIMLLLEGLPLFYMELALGQRMQKGSIKVWSDIRPYFKGIGVAQVLVSFNMTSYYPMVMSWCMYYFYLSFKSPLPWTQCADTVMNSTTCCNNDSAKYYWYVTALKATPDITDPSSIVPHLALCWCIGWVLTYACLFKGVESSGKASYFTATFPYVVLICLFFRGVTLPGAWNGIKVFLRPDYSRLVDPVVWTDAAGQIFYSLAVGFGSLICFGSFLPKRNNVTSDAMFIAVVNCGTSVFAGVVVYAILGYREYELGIKVEDVEGGPGLAFMAYATAVAQMPLPQLWAVLFFFMMVLLTLCSEFGVIEACVSPLVELKIFQGVRREIVCLVLCSIMCVVGFPMCCQNGLYIFTLWDTYSVSLPLLFIGIVESIAVSWFYGWKRFNKDIELMTGSQPHIYWQLCWRYMSPCIISVVLLASLVQQIVKPALYTVYTGCTEYPLSDLYPGTDTWIADLPYPWWAQCIAALMVIVPLTPILVVGLLNSKKSPVPIPELVWDDVDLARLDAEANGPVINGTRVSQGLHSFYMKVRGCGKDEPKGIDPRDPGYMPSTTVQSTTVNGVVQEGIVLSNIACEAV